MVLAQESRENSTTQFSVEDVVPNLETPKIEPENPPIGDGHHHDEDMKHSNNCNNELTAPKNECDDRSHGACGVASKSSREDCDEGKTNKNAQNKVFRLPTQKAALIHGWRFLSILSEDQIEI